MFLEENAVRMPLLALRGLVVFPKTVASFDVARKKSLNALKAAMNGNRYIFVVTQKDFYADEPTEKDLYSIGCIARIKQILKVSDTLSKVLVEGVARAEYSDFVSGKEFYTANVFKVENKPLNNRAVYKETLIRRIRSDFRKYISVLPNIAPDVVMTVEQIEDIAF